MITLVKTYWHDFWYSPEKAALQLRVFFGGLAVALTQVDVTWMPPWARSVLAVASAMMAFATKAGERNPEP